MAAKKPPPSTRTQPYSRSIPAALHGAVMERLRTIDPDTRRTHGIRAVARWLAEAHGIRVHSSTVARLRVSLEKHTEAQVVAALREELRDTIAPTRAKLSRALRKLDALVATSRDPKAVAAAVNATTRALHELTTLGGVAAPQQIDLTSGGKPLDHARAAIAAQIARLASGPDPGPAGGAGRADGGG